MTDLNYTHVAFLLDRTGSMYGISDDAIGGFNTLVADQKKAPGRCTLTLVQFDSQDPQEIIHDRQPIAQIPDLTEETYQPRASTPLLDAMGHLIVHTGQQLAAMAESDRPGKVVFAVLTDGLENASREYTHPQVLDLVRQQKQQYGWQFMFLGADQDAIAEASDYGMDADLAMTVGKTPEGTRMAFDSASAAMRKIRRAKNNGARFSVAFSSKERRTQADEVRKQASGSA